MQLQATLCLNQQSLPLLTWVDSCADENFLDENLLFQVGISCELLDSWKSMCWKTPGPCPYRALFLLLLGNHLEQIQFNPISSPHTPLILDHPWLRWPDPHINNKVVSWSSSSHSSCLQSSLPGSSLPISRLYNLVHLDRDTMEKYINESLATSIIRPSSFPIGAGFSFVAENDGSLCPCIDYWGLNIIVKNKYPLFLINSAFEPLHGASVFTKPDLRNAYHLVRIQQVV